MGPPRLTAQNLHTIRGTPEHQLPYSLAVGYKILVVEDEGAIADAVAARLRSEQFEVEIAGDGLTAVELCEISKPDLVVLDLMLPGIDGLEVCRRIQQERRVPVLILTARDEEADVVIGLGVGADDYLTKPFSPRELVARIHAILRRSESDTGSHDVLEPTAGLRLDQQRRRCWLDDVEVHLTSTEFDLVWVLASADGAVLSREQLLQRVWGYRDGSGARTVDSHVRAVRRKIYDDVIRTVHTVGYGFGGGHHSS